MHKYVIGFIVGLMTLGLVLAAEQQYTLRVITDVDTQAAQSAKDGGRVALVAELAEDGSLASEWETYCVLSVK